MRPRVQSLKEERERIKKLLPKSFADNLQVVAFCKFQGCQFDNRSPGNVRILHNGAVVGFVPFVGSTA